MLRVNSIRTALFAACLVLPTMATADLEEKLHITSFPYSENKPADQRCVEWDLNGRFSSTDANYDNRGSYLIGTGCHYNDVQMWDLSGNMLSMTLRGDLRADMKAVKKYSNKKYCMNIMNNPQPIEDGKRSVYPIIGWSGCSDTHDQWTLYDEAGSKLTISPDGAKKDEFKTEPVTIKSNWNSYCLELIGGSSLSIPGSKDRDFSLVSNLNKDRIFAAECNNKPEQKWIIRVVTRNN